MSCGARLAVFDIEELREITAYDELHLDTIGDKRTALFLIMSDTDASFNFLISMAYSQLFNLLCEKADDVYGGRLPVHVRCLIDEFANIGQIPNFEKLVATIRSREISACIVLQAQSQLKAIYKDNADRFGDGFSFERAGTHHFLAKVHVNASSAFWAWVFAFGGKMKVVGPDRAKEQYAARLHAALSA